MRNILLVGGDARTLEVIRYLSFNNDSVSVIGFDQYNFEDGNIRKLAMSRPDFAGYDVLILPVEGVSSSGEIRCPYAETSFTLTEKMVAETPDACRIFTGIANDYLKQITSNRRLEVIFSRDDIAIYNAIPTAEATLQLAIEHTDVTIHGTQVAVLGFGRVGFAVAKLFKDVGADVTVFMRSDTDFAKSAGLGVRAVSIHELHANINNFPICINTVPSLLLNEKALASMTSNSLVIDLASMLGGTDFQAAEKHGIHAIHALGLPGKTAPKTAGTILANTIWKMLH